MDVLWVWYAVCGVLLTVFVASVIVMSVRLRTKEILVARLSALLESREQEIGASRDEAEKLAKRLDHEVEEKIALRERLTSSTTTLSQLLEEQSRQQQFFEAARQELTTKFENVVTRIFEQRSERLNAVNRSSMDTIVSPLREQLKDFSRTVQSVYQSDTTDRALLRKEIEDLKSLNLKMSQDALNLTRALKGETKTQGVWGEFILERVLEMSGLRKGKEYEVQGSFRDEQGRQKRPDVIIHLPDGKQVVVDSKVSLTAYERYSSADQDKERERFMKDHLASLRAHVSMLASKQYEDLPQLNTLNYVLLFIPLESAYMAGIEHDQELFQNAMSKNIILVSPSTLLATLRTIQSIWRFEQQNRNAKEIARRAGDLHDKFVGFVSDLTTIGQRIDQTRTTYDAAMSKLCSGKGNLVRRVEMLRELGATTKKSLPGDMLDGGDEDNAG